jgi:hypothetical protein
VSGVLWRFNSMLLTAQFEPDDKTLAVVVPSVIGLAGTLLTVAVAWAKDLNSSAKRIRIIDEATKRVQFWDTWLKAVDGIGYEEIGLAKEKARGQVLAVSEAVEIAFHNIAAAKTGAEIYFELKRQSLSHVRRWFLLYKPARARAWIPRVLFYIYIILAIFLFVELAFLNARFPKTLVVVSFLIAIFFRYLSLTLEQPKLAEPRGSVPVQDNHRSP